MKFKSALVTQVSGSLGGITFAHNQGGMYMRARSLVTNPASEAQQVIRNAMSSAHTAWRALTEEIRYAWKNYAQGTPLTNPLGDSKHISGLAMFLRQFVSRAQADVTQITVAPDMPGLTTLSEVTVTQHLAQDAFDFAYNAGDDWCITTGGYLAVFQSDPYANVNNFFKGPYNYLGKLLGKTAAPPASPFFANSLTPLESGQRYFFRVIAVDYQGRMSAPQFLQFDVP